jgi:hypothetical protein
MTRGYVCRISKSFFVNQIRLLFVTHNIYKTLQALTIGGTSRHYLRRVVDTLSYDSVHPIAEHHGTHVGN